MVAEWKGGNRLKHPNLNNPSWRGCRNKRLIRIFRKYPIRILNGNCLSRPRIPVVYTCYSRHRLRKLQLLTYPCFVRIIKNKLLWDGVLTEVRFVTIVHAAKQTSECWIIATLKFFTLLSTLKHVIHFLEHRLSYIILIHTTDNIRSLSSLVNNYYRKTSRPLYVRRNNGNWFSRHNRLNMCCRNIPIFTHMKKYKIC